MNMRCTCTPSVESKQKLLTRIFYVSVPQLFVLTIDGASDQVNVARARDGNANDYYSIPAGGATLLHIQANSALQKLDLK